ncbi:hypothetical protein FOZ62_014494 [Perkinsus olseni]|uniref:Uncharacterized protein n=1 Tax=Perkinsus olseni TaxID=32597 RepID=A0A7J6TYN0_PEROL|nr:hypothetical protein FOZ62_014494 [Perkinsus olseni]
MIVADMNQAHRALPCARILIAACVVLSGRATSVYSQTYSEFESRVACPNTARVERPFWANSLDDRERLD